VATNAIPPGLPPAGAFNSSDLPRYRYDPTAVKNLLLSAMVNPIKAFHFENGTMAPSGLFNDTFGCIQLSAGDRCNNPVTRSVPLTARVGDTVNIAIMNQIASTINNVSLGYNLGLHVYVQTVSPDIYYSNVRSYYMYSTGWVWDYPWVGDFDTAMFSPNPVVGFLPPDGWNVSSISTLWNQFASADTRGDLPGVIANSNRMNALANEMILYLWTFYPYFFFVHTSNIQGFSYNPSLYGTPFMTLNIANASQPQSSSSPLTYAPLIALALLAALVVVGLSLYVTRRSKANMAAPVARRLSAIMFTDIVGYTAMAQANEAHALDLLKSHRDLVRPLIAKHSGSEVKTIGDAFLVEFASALAATECAVDMMKALQSYNKTKTERLQMRIGIHVGDVVHEGGDVYGDAVNIASRIEPLARGGGTCISQQVYDQVRNKVPYRFVKLQLPDLKNVSVQIDVYRLEFSG
jgi:class 3 adenylate cyclase